MSKYSEIKRIYTIVFIPLVFIILIWLVKISETILEVRWSNFGLYPRNLRGLFGIISAPFLHSDFKHLISNSLPLLLLSVSIIYFYRKIAIKVFLLIYLFTHLMVWIFARESYHIGASGLVYGFASFLFFSGIISRFYRLMAISFLILFFYGGMVWGVFPFVKNMSWETHLFGFVFGMIFAFYFRDSAPKRQLYEWENEEEINDENEYWKDEEVKN